MKKQIALINGKVILENEIVPQNVFIEEGKIVEVSTRAPAKNAYFIDAHGLYVSPGFIDTHTHGRGGSDTMYDNFHDLNRISEYMLKSGTTAFLPTTITMPVEKTRSAIENVAKNVDKVKGAKILGVHVEGPFFCEKYKGAQPSEYMLPPTIENFHALAGEYGSIIKKISLAPELAGCDELIDYLVD